MSDRKSRILLFLIIGTLLISGCSPAVLDTPAAGNAQPSPTFPPPTHTSTATHPPPTPTSTALPPSPTPSATPTETVTPEPSDTPTIPPTDTSTPTSTPTTALSGLSGGYGTVQIYFILLGTGGPVACGDSLVSVGSGVPQSGDVASDVKGALKKLLSYKTKFVGGMYNPLYRSDIKVKEVKFDPKSGLITVQLTGSYEQPDDPCDNTRVREQVWYTVRQYPEVKATNIYLNNYPFGDKLSNGK